MRRALDQTADWIWRFLLKLGVGGALLAAGFFLLPLVFHKQADPAQETARPAVSAPEVKRAPREKAVIKRPVEYFAGDAKAKLRLPADVGANEQVIASSRIEPSDRRQTVTTTLDTESGNVRNWAKHEPYPLFAVEPRGEARLSVGYRYDGNGLVKTVARLSVNYDVLRVKAVTLGAAGSIDSDGRAFLGAGLAYRW